MSIPEPLEFYAIKLGYPHSERLGMESARSIVENAKQVVVIPCVCRCQFEAIDVDDIARIDLDSCFGRGNCVPTCPSDALVLEEVRPREFIRST